MVIVEGMNDVIRMDCLGVAAVGLCSNKATQHQIEMLVKFAQQVANNRIMLPPDCDEEGEAGSKERLWQLSAKKTETKLGWSRSVQGGCFANRQLESPEKPEWDSLN